MMNASQPNAADSEKPLVYDEEQITRFDGVYTGCDEDGGRLTDPV